MWNYNRAVADLINCFFVLNNLNKKILNKLYYFIQIKIILRNIETFNG